ncbi:ATP-dependent DNA helicase [Mesobacillus harenae]|uniref:ATP-dependent DNA helicase n=1 Tax=Mesobacillus harenae TaxID=2213203 RepID=UPI00157FE994|nr:ATP-dependent DNA helicase [Mesobacillus harenae]
MKVLFTLIIALNNWFFIPSDSPSKPVEVEGIDLNLKSAEIAVTFLSLTDGEAGLLQYASGENILINAGGPGTADEVQKLLALFDVENISTIILTRRDFNEKNLRMLIEQYQVKKVIIGKSFSSLNLDLDKSTTVELWEKGTNTELFPQFNVEVIYEGNKPGEGMDLSFRFLKHRILYLSSIGPEVESSLLNQSLQDVNVVKIPCYGIEGSISDRLIMHMDPQIAVIFNSKSEKPSADFVEELHENWIDVYLTKKHGTVTMKFTDINYEVITIYSGDELK